MHVGTSNHLETLVKQSSPDRRLDSGSWHDTKKLLSSEVQRRDGPADPGLKCDRPETFSRPGTCSKLGACPKPEHVLEVEPIPAWSIPLH